ncbi:ferric reductase-like transmembrane domain-containing protein, partial [Candidatus Dojkabacteria bacterium]|nr:ferric reductase-like transmembrane domain-containing protein [Candidatus Dojkabacteria bacterium]
MTKQFLYILILFFIAISFIFTRDLWLITLESNLAESYLYMIALQAGLIGGSLMWFQYILGIRAFTNLFTKDILGVLSVHKNIGIYGMLIVFFHPLLIILYNLNLGINLLIPKFDTAYDIGIRLGTTAFFFFLIIWISSALLRTRLGFRSWKLLHFMSYLIFPFIFLHGVQVGFTINNTGYTAIWYFYGVTYLLLTLYRIIFQFGFKKYKYEVKKINDEANGIKKLVLKPIENHIKKVIPGQFEYLTIKGFYRESHPFTIADFNEETKEITHVIKKFGKWTKNLDKFYVGQKVTVDGPYGIFLKDVMRHDNIFFY